MPPWPLPAPCAWPASRHGLWAAACACWMAKTPPPPPTTTSPHPHCGCDHGDVRETSRRRQFGVVIVIWNHNPSNATLRASRTTPWPPQGTSPFATAQEMCSAAISRSTASGGSLRWSSAGLEAALQTSSRLHSMHRKFRLNFREDRLRILRRHRFPPDGLFSRKNLNAVCAFAPRIRDVSTNQSATQSGASSPGRVPARALIDGAVLACSSGIARTGANARRA